MFKWVVKLVAGTGYVGWSGRGNWRSLRSKWQYYGLKALGSRAGPRALGWPKVALGKD